MGLPTTSSQKLPLLGGVENYLMPSLPNFIFLNPQPAYRASVYIVV